MGRGWEVGHREGGGTRRWGIGRGRGWKMGY